MRRELLIKTSVLLTLSLCFAQSSLAFYVDGNSLLADCTSDSPALRDRCDAYIVGAIDSYEQWQAWGDLQVQICRPPGVAITQLRTLVVKQLREDRIHLDDLHKQASGAVLNALMVSFPCVRSGSLASSP